MNNPREQIGQKIDHLFGDTSRPASETLGHLEWIAERAEELAQTLRDDGVKSDYE